MRALTIITTLILTVAAGCGSSSSGGGGGTVPPAGDHGDKQIHLSGTQFTPAMVTIKAGQSVEWIWDEGRHDVNSGTMCTPDGKFGNGKLQTTGNYVFKFATAGEFPFYCTPHCGVGMVGKVVVTP
ncbi:MAG: hypothetical protein NVS3B20_07690 [Polyangiales bacterium]